MTNEGFSSGTTEALLLGGRRNVGETQGVSRTWSTPLMPTRATVIPGVDRTNYGTLAVGPRAGKPLANLAGHVMCRVSGVMEGG
jgi:hypothetical protein